MPAGAWLQCDQGLAPACFHARARAGTVHVVVGTGGGDLDTSACSAPWLAACASVFGYLRVLATRADLALEFVRNTDGAVLDSATLTPW